MKNIIYIALFFVIRLYAQEAPQLTQIIRNMPVHAIEDYFDTSSAPFYHGVASGDPLADAVIIWTRITTNESEAEVNWKIATDSQMSNIIGNGNNQNASITNTNNELDTLFTRLKAEINSLAISQEEIQDNIESVIACEDLAKQEKPKKGAVKRLLSTLPELGSVASIVSAILAML